MSNIPYVLVFSKDQMLLQTRQLILAAFFHVECADEIHDVEALIAQHHFDLILLCHSLSSHECQRVLDLVDAQSTDTRILMLTVSGSDPANQASGHALISESGPYQLLKKSAELLGVELNENVRLVST